MCVRACVCDHCGTVLSPRIRSIQSNLAKGRIAVPLPVKRSWTPSNTWFLGLANVNLPPKRLIIGLAVFAQYVIRVPNKEQTDHATCIYSQRQPLAIGGILHCVVASSACWQFGLEQIYQGPMYHGFMGKICSATKQIQICYLAQKRMCLFICSLCTATVFGRPGPN